MKTGKVAALVLTTIAFLAANEASAQVSYAAPSSTYSQNFDSLPITPQNTSLGASPAGWRDDSASPSPNFSIVGWYLYHPTLQVEGGFNGRQRVRIGAGTANTGSFMSFGASGSTERALGSLASNTLTPGGQSQFIGLRLRNDTGSTLGSFTLAYSGEQWRDGGATTPVAQNLVFAWSTTALAVSDPDTSFTSVAQLGYTSPVFANTGTGAAVDGNVAGKVLVSAFTVQNINWAPGSDLWLRWSDLNDSGNDHGFAIDDLSFSAALIVPEPTSAALLGLGFLAVVLRRRN